MTKPLLSDVTKWLADLGAGRQEFNNKSVREVYRELRPMAASLVKAYDAEAFQTDSREAVAATLKWWREADIRERLDMWVIERRREREPLTRPSDYVLSIMLNGCGGRPGPLLTAWLADRGIVPPYPRYEPASVTLAPAPVVALPNRGLFS